MCCEVCVCLHSWCGAAVSIWNRTHDGGHLYMRLIGFNQSRKRTMWNETSCVQKARIDDGCSGSQLLRRYALASLCCRLRCNTRATDEMMINSTAARAVMCSMLRCCPPLHLSAMIIDVLWTCTLHTDTHTQRLSRFRCKVARQDIENRASKIACCVVAHALSVSFIKPQSLCLGKTEAKASLSVRSASAIGCKGYVIIRLLVLILKIQPHTLRMQMICFRERTRLTNDFGEHKTQKIGWSF